MATTEDRAEAPASRALPVILLLSAGIAAFLFWLIYFRARSGEPAWIGGLPTANAGLNALSAVCLTCGYVQVRRRNYFRHMCFMIGATVFSALFLVGYITYHYFHGDTKFAGHGWIRPAYFALLISHILMSMIALPLVLTTLWLAATRRFRTHRKVARWTFPIWLYVSVTGVLVYSALRW